MADDANPMEPPKVNPLAKPAVPHGTTIRLKPVIRTGATAMKTGLRLPPRPGMTTAAKPVPKPAAAPAPAPAPAPAAAPAAAGLSSTKSLEALKSITSNLKSITAPIPQQAILHKTGIIADPGMTAAQMAAAKARTSRISLSDAMGAAPVKNENAPMKTIRIKRPVDIPGTTTHFPHPQDVAPAAPAPAAEPLPAAPAAPAAAAPAAAPAEATVTQRKTLKVARPGSAVRPSGKFGLKKPSSATQASTVVKQKPAEGAAPEGAPANDEIADIPDMPATPAPAFAAPGLVPPAPAANANVEKDVPSGVAVMGLIVQAAACVAMGLLAYKLYFDTTVSPF